jgi:tRNA G18 (ribose-2'-O)-methylase SpoU
MPARYGVLFDDNVGRSLGLKALRASAAAPSTACAGSDESALERMKAGRATAPGGGRDPEATTSMYDARLGGPLVLVVGSEGAGVPPEVARSADMRVRIPMRARVESLNVSVAAALLLYEAARQREWVETV